MGYKSRNHYAQGEKVSDDKWNKIFNKCNHEVAKNIYPPICIKCNELLEVSNEHEKRVKK